MDNYKCTNWNPSKGKPWPPVYPTRTFPVLTFEGPIDFADRTTGRNEIPEDVDRAKQKYDEYWGGFGVGRTISFAESKRLFEEIRLLYMKLEGIQIVELLRVTPDAAVSLIRNRDEGGHVLPTRSYTMELTYPFRECVRLVVPPYEVIGMRKKFKRQDLGWILWAASQAYQYVYESHHVEFGVWGHDIGDLYFESVRVFDHEIEIFVGS